MVRRQRSHSRTNSRSCTSTPQLLIPSRDALVMGIAPAAAHPPGCTGPRHLLAAPPARCWQTAGPGSTHDCGGGAASARSARPGVHCPGVQRGWRFLIYRQRLNERAQGSGSQRSQLLQQRGAAGPMPGFHACCCCCSRPLARRPACSLCALAGCEALLPQRLDVARAIFGARSSVRARARRKSQPQLPCRAKQLPNAARQCAAGNAATPDHRPCSASALVIDRCRTAPVARTLQPALPATPACGSRHNGAAASCRVPGAPARGPFDS